MARPLRIEFPDALHHVTARGNEQRPIFRSDVDRHVFLRLLGQAAERFGWSVTAFVLMTNHFHLVVQTPEANLSRGMHWLNGTYAGAFNRRYKRRGHLFQGRFHSRLIEKESHFTEVLRYTVMNPVRANMAPRPEKYRWSSYRATAGLEPAPAWLDVDAALQWFGADRQAAAEAYQRYVVARLDCDESLWDSVRHGIFLGRDPWMVQMRTRVESELRSTDHPLAQRAVGRPAMTNIVQAVSSVAGIAAEEVRSRRWRALRDLVAWLGWYEGLLTLRSVGASLRLRSEGHVSRLIRRCDAAFATDPWLLATHDRALAALRR